jgi:hypothetical protein
LFSQHIRGWHGLAAVDGMVGEAKAWIETFGGQVGNLEGIGAVGLGDPVADGLGQRMGQGAGVMVGNND